jgi:hypothetical protein
MVLIDAVFDGLQEITVDQARRKRTHSVFSDQHIPTRQERRGIGADIGENDSGQFLRFLGFLLDTVLKRALRWFAGHLQNISVDIVEPAVIAAA